MRPNASRGCRITQRIEPQRRFAEDYSGIAILRFKATASEETYFGGDSMGDIMQLAPASESFIERNVDRDYPDGDNESLTLHGR